MSSKSSKSRNKNSSPAWLKWTIIAILGVLAVAVIAGVLLNRPADVANSSTNQSLSAEISVDKAYKMYEDGTFLLDVRTQEEWNDYHVPDTTLIPLDQLADRLSEVPKDQPVVVVCRSGNRSQQGRDILKQAGFEQVTSMAGGLKTWQAQGYPVTSDP
jgi:rhodanese-related sulfurtransferase